MRCPQLVISKLLRVYIQITGAFVLFVCVCRELWKREVFMGYCFVFVGIYLSTEMIKQVCVCARVCVWMYAAMLPVPMRVKGRTSSLETFECLLLECDWWIPIKNSKCVPMKGSQCFPYEGNPSRAHREREGPFPSFY